MKQTNDENQLVRYLLGQSPEEERTLIEERYLADPDFHMELQAAERDLIDQYVSGELSNPTEFEKHFLTSSRRREKVEFARALKQSLARPALPAQTAAAVEPASSREGLFSFFAAHRLACQAVAAAVLIFLGGWLLISSLRQSVPPAQIVQTPPPQADPVVPQASPNPPGPPPVQPPLPVATFILAPSLTRDISEVHPLVMAANVEVAFQLHLETAGDYKSYRVVLRTAGGDEIWRQDQLRSLSTTSGPAVTVKPPAKLFSDRDYTIRLSGVSEAGDVDDLASYYFRVQKK